MNKPMLESNEVRIPLKKILSVVLAVVLITVIMYVYKWGVGFFEKIEQWGQLGDFFGGILNPIIGLASVILISFTLRQNQTALAFTAEELKKSGEQLELSAKALKSQEDLMRQESYTLALTTICNVYREELAKDRKRFNKSIDDLAFELRRAIVAKRAVPDITIRRFQYYSRTNLRFLIPIAAKLKNIDDQVLKVQLYQLIVAYLSTDVISSAWFVFSLKDEQPSLYLDICYLCEELLRSCHMGKLVTNVKRQIKDAKLKALNESAS